MPLRPRPCGRRWIRLAGTRRKFTPDSSRGSLKRKALLFGRGLQLLRNVGGKPHDCDARRLAVFDTAVSRQRRKCGSCLRRVGGDVFAAIPADHRRTCGRHLARGAGGRSTRRTTARPSDRGSASGGAGAARGEGSHRPQRPTLLLRTPPRRGRISALFAASLTGRSPRPVRADSGMDAARSTSREVGVPRQAPLAREHMTGA
jgi:hypothetical protein